VDTRDFHQVLINEKYIGNNVWNRWSFKLKKKRLHNSPDIWIRAEGAFEPIVERSLFEAAQAIIRERSHKLSDEEMLGALQRLLQDRGHLSGLIIDDARVVRYLAQHHREILAEFQKIAGMEVAAA
jgi:hypothetical protein